MFNIKTLTVLMIVTLSLFFIAPLIETFLIQNLHIQNETIVLPVKFLIMVIIGTLFSALLRSKHKENDKNE